ncbi:MAG: DNA-processing protein DprA [Bulleidia sp.]
MRSERELLAAYAVRYQGDWKKISAAIAGKEPVRAYEGKDPYLTIADEEYPASLRRLRFPPWVLFYAGNPELLKYPAVTIIGSRDMHAYGKQMTELAASILAERYVLVSGLAKGVDGTVHRTALAEGGHTIGVIGCGLNISYPRCNQDLYSRMAEDQLILSEYPRDTMPEAWHFPWRNRILAALGDAVVVTEAKRTSGTMHTVNEAISLSKEVWCVPYPFGAEEGEGCNLLISEGADLLVNEDSLRDLAHAGKDMRLAEN